MNAASWTAFFIIAILVVATLTGQILADRAKSDESRKTIDNLNARTRAWWAMVVIMGGALMLGHYATTLLFAFVSFMALREFWSLAPSGRGDHHALFVSFFAILPIQFALVWSDWISLFSIFIPVYAYLGLAAIATLTGDTKDFLARSAKVQWGLMLCVYTISHIPALTLLETGSSPTLLVVYLLIVVQLSDVLQYVFGKLFGKTRISRNISPSKTLEGLIGGGVSAIVIGALLHPLTPFSILQSAFISGAIVIAGFFGGFVLSAVKRDLAVKDWGTLIEGHGGVLDRVDSLTFAAPILFHITNYWFTV